MRVHVSVREHTTGEQHCKASFAALRSPVQQPVLPSVELQCLLPVMLPHSLASLLLGLLERGAGRGQDTSQILYSVLYSQGSFMQLGIKMANYGEYLGILASWFCSLVLIPLLSSPPHPPHLCPEPAVSSCEHGS